MASSPLKLKSDEHGLELHQVPLFNAMQCGCSCCNLARTKIHIAFHQRSFAILRVICFYFRPSFSSFSPETTLWIIALLHSYRIVLGETLLKRYCGRTDSSITRNAATLTFFLQIRSRTRGKRTGSKQMCTLSNSGFKLQNLMFANIMLYAVALFSERSCMFLSTLHLR